MINIDCIITEGGTIEATITKDLTINVDIIGSGPQGEKGDTGKSLEFTWNGTQLGIRQEGDATYQYVNLKGDKGDIGNTGKGLEFIWNGTQLGVRVEGDATYQYVNLKGDKGEQGDTGNGISSIVKTSGTGAAGTTDTYTITFTNGATTTFQVYNGADGLESGDMLKSIYDTNDDGKVNKADDADKFGGQQPAYYAKATDIPDISSKLDNSHNTDEEAHDDIRQLINDLDANKVDNSRVLTDVPLNAKFTDTVTTINGKTGAIAKADIVALGIPAQDTDTTYSEISTSEIDAGTSTTSRTITAQRLKYATDKVGITLGTTQPTSGWWFKEI